MAEYIESVANADGVGEANKIKTPFAQIIVEGTAEKPCYSILWWDEEKKEGNIGYSSYNLEYVRKWLKEEFEVTEDLITADVAPVVHGRWVNKQEKDTFAGYLTRFVCSECGRVEQAKEPYCHCGAKMDGDG